MTITVRKAKKSDLPTLKEFEQGIITIERPMDPTLSADPLSYYDLEKLIDLKDAEVVVACHGDLIVSSGYAKIKEAKPYLDHDLFAYIGFMFVLPEYRGHGISKMVLDSLIEWADNRSINEIRLEVYDENQGAVRAYEKAGFKKNMVEMRLVR